MSGACTSALMDSQFLVGAPISMPMSTIRFDQQADGRPPRDLVQAKLDREVRRLDGEQAVAEYAAKRAAVSDTISRLREQRLAREAAESAAAAEAAANAPAKKRKIRRVGR